MAEELKDNNPEKKTKKNVKEKKAKKEKKDKKDKNTEKIENLDLNYSSEDANRSDILKDVEWLETLINARINNYLYNEEYDEIAPPDLSQSETHYANFIKRFQLSIDERKIILLTLANEFKSKILTKFSIISKESQKLFTGFGGKVLNQYGDFSPTIKTALFLLGSCDFDVHLKYYTLLNKTHRLYKENLICEKRESESGIAGNRGLYLSNFTLMQIFEGKEEELEYSENFPAKKLTTPLEWEDLILQESTKDSLKELMAWLEHNNENLSKMKVSKNIQPGYRILFYGPPGTGKTLTAGLIGKKINKDVYRVDLSQLVSKYVGETEKNLEKIFSVGEKRNWILFFDEADALFGKRTSIGSANDRFANQETAYLLQRIESYNNLIILASNLRKNLDEAFARRFQSVVYFPIPEKEERYNLWKNAFQNEFIFDENLDLKEIAEKYDIAGGSIVNVLRYTTLMALSKNTVYITKKDFMDGLKREYHKIGRTL